MHTKKFILLALLKNQYFSSKNYVFMTLRLNRALTKKLVALIAKRDILIKDQGSSYSCYKHIYNLCTERIRKYTKLPVRSQIQLIESLDNVDSTNKHIKKHFAEKTALSGKIFLCLSEQQTNGRGRGGRSWVSPYSQNIYQSLYFLLSLSEKDADILSLNTSLTIIKALSQFDLEQGAVVKLPNDIFWKGRKVGGVLIEILKVYEKKFGVIIGIGINIKAPNNAISKYSAVGIEEAAKINTNKNYLCGIMINQFFGSAEKLISL